ncbi:MAG: hypothetical protein K0U38_04270 [Epsilonproteobacteria bacterium]|nr:hypothetical protein [Campylobacterota bacterium]
MIEMIAKITLWLAIALLIGVMIGWFISNIIKEKENFLEMETLEKSLEEKSKKLREVESHAIGKKLRIDKLIDEGIVCRHELLQKSNFLRKASDELFKIQDKLEHVQVLEKEKSELLRKVSEQNIMINEQKSEIAEFEKVVMKADALIAKREDSQNSSTEHEMEFEVQKLKKLIDEQEKKIDFYKNELEVSKELERKSLKTHIYMSKDQFNEIEKQLLAYKRENDALKVATNQLEKFNVVKQEIYKPTLLEKLKSRYFYWKEVATAKLLINSHRNATKV